MTNPGDNNAGPFFQPFVAESTTMNQRENPPFIATCCRIHGCINREQPTTTPTAPEVAVAPQDMPRWTKGHFCHNQPACCTSITTRTASACTKRKSSNIDESKNFFWFENPPFHINFLSVPFKTSIQHGYKLDFHHFLMTFHKQLSVPQFNQPKSDVFINHKGLPLFLRGAPVITCFCEPFDYRLYTYTNHLRVYIYIFPTHISCTYIYNYLYTINPSL